MRTGTCGLEHACGLERVDWNVRTGTRGLGLGDVGLGDVKLRDVELGDVGLGDVGLGDVGLGDVGLGDVGLGYMGLGYMGLGGVGLGDVGLGDVGLGDVGLRDVDAWTRGRDKQTTPDICAEFVLYNFRWSRESYYILESLSVVADDFQHPWFGRICLLACLTVRTLSTE